MNRLVLLSQDGRVFMTVKEIDEKFHGKITVHFAGGIPRKVEMNKVEDISSSQKHE